jgi:hypothetical protein
MTPRQRLRRALATLRRFQRRKAAKGLPVARWIRCIERELRAPTTTRP